MTRTYRIVLPLLGAWLAGWMYVSWAAIQDDALIHLRYADNLLLHRFITYDGAHGDYGASSLLYVALLALLRGFTASPNLPRALSSAVHGVMFVGFASAIMFLLPKQARLARLAGMTLLILLVTPSAVRWLDDGMETGVAVLLASLLAWQIHEQAVPAVSREAIGGPWLLALLAFLAVMLRTELVLLCAVGFLILALERGEKQGLPLCNERATAPGLPLLAGALSALGLILATMHVLLPDTAIAKSHGIGHWFNPLHDAAITLGGAMSFGLGMLTFWLLTLLLAVLHQGRLRGSTALANAFFPVVLALASSRGQEIQGVRYFAWTFFFPVVWNVLELARESEVGATLKWRDSRGALLLSGFLLVLTLAMPFEVRAMYRVLTHRSETMRSFEAQRLDVLRDRRGMASDIGYIGYFSGAQICDLAGLVNGRAAARLGSAARNQTCVATDPDFLFVNLSQFAPLERLADFSSWQVCGRYDFTNVRTLDSHYLVVRPSIAQEVCRATGRQSISIADVSASGL